MSTARKQYKVVYTVVERRGRKFWLRIGAAFPNRDGSINVQLDAVPTNGQLQIRDDRASEESGAPRSAGEASSDHEHGPRAAQRARVTAD